MKSQNANAAVAKRPQAAAEPKVLFAGMVPIKDIEIGDNPRKTFDPKKMAELTESVRTKGVVQAILLRPNGKDLKLNRKKLEVEDCL